MKSLQDFLEVIEKGDSTEILDQPLLRQKFDNLLEHELIELHEGKVTLTEKGDQAKTAGIWAVIENQQQPAQEIPKKKPPFPKKGIAVMAVGCCVAFLIFLLLI